MRIGLNKDYDVAAIMRLTLNALALEAERGKILNAETLRNARVSVDPAGRHGELGSCEIVLPMWAEPEPSLDTTDFTGGRKL